MVTEVDKKIKKKYCYYLRFILTINQWEFETTTDFYKVVIKNN